MSEQQEHNTGGLSGYLLEKRDRKARRIVDAMVLSFWGIVFIGMFVFLLHHGN